MKKKQLFSVLVVMALVLSFSLTAFAVSEYTARTDLNEYDGYFTVMDAKATKNTDGTYRADVTTYITSKVNASSLSVMAGSSTILKLEPSVFTADPAYATEADFNQNASMGNSYRKVGLPGLAGDLSFKNSWVNLDLEYDDVNFDTAGNQRYENVATFEKMTAEPGDKFKVSTTEWIDESQNNLPGVQFYSYKDGSEHMMNVVDVDKYAGYIYIPMTVSYNLSAATAGTAPADQTQYADDVFATPAKPDDLKKTDAKAMGWTDDPDAADTVYTDSDAAEYPEVIPFGGDYSLDDTNYDGGDVTLYVVWLEDKNNDDVEDEAQVTVTYNIVNGKWIDGNNEVATITATLNLMKDGKIDKTGEAKLGDSIPTNINPDDTFTTAGEWTDAKAPTTVITIDADTAITADTTYTLTLTKVVYKDNANGEFTPDPVPTAIPVAGDTLADAAGNNYIVDRVEGPVNGVTTVYCDKDNIGGPNGPDGKPDKFQLTVTYKVVGGTWIGTNPASDTVEVVLDKLVGTEPNENGTARLNQNGAKVYAIADAEADDRHSKDEYSWSEEEPKAATIVDGDVTYTLTLKEVAKYVFYDESEGRGANQRVKVEVADDEVPANPEAGTKVEATNGKTYAVTEVSDEKENGSFIVYVLPDGDPNDPENQPDGIPDKYQKDVTLKVANGTWADGSEGEKTYKVELKDPATDKWAEDGEGTIDPFPTGMIPEVDNLTGEWDNADLPKVKGNNAETFTYTFTGEDIEITDPEDPTKPLADVIKIRRWDGTPRNEPATYEKTVEFALAIDDEKIANSNIVADIMNSAKYAAFDPATKEFGEPTDTTDKLGMDINLSGKVTFTAKFSGITKVILSYAGMEHEFIIITPGDVNLNGELDSQDWQWTADYVFGERSELPDYSYTFNGKPYDFLTLMMDMDRNELDTQVTYVDAHTIIKLTANNF